MPSSTVNTGRRKHLPVLKMENSTSEPQSCSAGLWGDSEWSKRISMQNWGYLTVWFIQTVTTLFTFNSYMFLDCIWPKLLFTLHKIIWHLNKCKCISYFCHSQPLNFVFQNLLCTLYNSWYGCHHKDTVM